MFFDDVDCSEDGKKNFHRVTFTPCESSNTTHVWCVLLLHTSSFSSFLRRRFLGGEEGEVRGGSGQLSIGGWMFWMTHAIIPSVTNLHKSVTSQAYSSQLRHFDESGLFINFSVVLFKFSFVRKKCEEWDEYARVDPSEFMVCAKSPRGSQTGMRDDPTFTVTSTRNADRLSEVSCSWIRAE